jgi:phosphoribosyl-ATP pyrophosphohydrolase/phosphoribosyl-AMP cyclohydrolase
MIRNKVLTNRAIREEDDLESLKFWENGLLPVVTQDASSGAVLMVAFANREALARTLETGQMHYWSRSRQELWHKGATSGNYQNLISLHMDCDGDTLLARVHQMGPACHTGESTCFGELPADADAEGPDLGGNIRAAPCEETLPNLWATLQSRASRRPEGSYTVRLLNDENLRLKKLGEETAELLLALAKEDGDRIRGEAADLVYHLLVALLASGVTLDGLLSELDSRGA